MDNKLASEKHNTKTHYQNILYDITVNLTNVIFADLGSSVSSSDVERSAHHWNNGSAWSPGKLIINKCTCFRSCFIYCNNILYSCSLHMQHNHMNSTFQARTHQLLSSNKDLLDQVSNLVNRLQSLETRFTEKVDTSSQPRPQQQQPPDQGKVGNHLGSFFWDYGCAHFWRSYCSFHKEGLAYLSIITISILIYLKVSKSEVIEYHWFTYFSRSSPLRHSKV